MNNAQIAAQMYRHRGSAPISGLWGAYSLLLFVSGYAGNCLNVRRSSDNTTQDIGFSGGVIDSAALLTFVGANDGFVTKWYDQSGLTNDISQGTTTLQPKIVDAGTYISEVEWDGVDDYLVSANNSGTPQVVSVYIAGRGRKPPQGVAGAANVLWAHANATANEGNVAPVRGNASFNTSGTYQINIGPTAIVASSYFGSLAQDGQVNCAVIDHATVASSGIQQYLNGVLQTAQSSSGVPTGNYAAGKWFFGASVTPSLYARLAASSMLVYEAKHLAPQVATISSSITPAIQGGIDGLTTGIWGIWSLRKQLSAYAGKCINVRRSSDNTTQDIGFVGRLLDTAALLTFVGANSGFVTKMYDQSGLSHDISQGTAANQPRIVNAGVVDPGVTFDGSNDFFASAASTSATTKFTLFCKGVYTIASLGIVFESSAAYNSNNGNAFYYSGSQAVVGCGGTAPNQSAEQFNTNFSNQVLCAAIDRSQTTNATQAKMYSGGSLMVADTNGSSGAVPSGNSGTAPWFIGGRSGGTLPSAGPFETFVIYEALISDANIDRISRGLG